MTPGAWASRTVVAVALGEVTPLPASLREVLLARMAREAAAARIRQAYGPIDPDAYAMWVERLGGSAPSTQRAS